MAKYFLLASLAVSSILCQDRYWGSYSAVYPAGGSGSSADVAYDVANLQEASRRSLFASVPSAPAPRAPAPRTPAPRAPAQKTAFASQQKQSFGQAAAGPAGYVHNTAGDSGGGYVHDTTGDHGPYYYWKLRQQAKAGVAAPAPAAPQRQIVTVRKQRPAQQPAWEAPVQQAAPAQQRYFQPAPAQAQQPAWQAPAPAQQPAWQAPAPAAPARAASQYGQAQAPEYQNDFSQRAYAYTAPTYSAQAQGVSFSYNAQF